MIEWFTLTIINKNKTDNQPKSQVDLTQIELI